MPVYDDDGNELEMLTCVRITPIEYVDVVIDAFKKYVDRYKIPHLVEDMLNHRLGKNGVITHRACQNPDMMNSVENMLFFADEYDHPFISTKLYNLSDTPEDILSQMSIVVCDNFEQFLDYVGLEKINA